MDFSKIKVPFIDKTEIKKRAIAFRQKYWGVAVPVDIEHIIEVDLGLDIIPVPGLVQRCNTDALVTSDWSSMYVDNERYLDERWYNRLRFSLAHEIGHWVLHRQLDTRSLSLVFEKFWGQHSYDDLRITRLLLE